MKHLKLLLWLIAHLVVPTLLLAGNTTLVNDSTSSLSSGAFLRTASVNLDSYNSTSVTISVTAWARYDSAHTPSDDAVVNALVQAGPANFYQGGSNEITLPVTATFTKSGGQWFWNGSPTANTISARGSVNMSNIGRETGVGDGTITITVSWVDGPANTAPTITWNSSPASVASGQTYSISAHGHDAEGNLTQVNVWKNGAGFAFAGGGNGTDGDSGNLTADTGPTTITFTANAVDADGATSATISQTVIVTAANTAPTIAWTATPGSVATGQSYTISAHGHDADGNLAEVNIWKDGGGFAFAGGSNGTDGDSGNSTSDAGPTTITFTANAVDSNGVGSGTISQTVTISAPPSVAASISASPTSATAPGSTTISWSSSNATAVSVSGNGVSSSAASGNQVVNGLSDGTYTYTITAQGYGGPSSQTATFTVNAPANNAPTIAWTATPGTVASGQSYTISAHGYDVDGNLAQVNIWKNGVGFAFAGGGNGNDGDSGNLTSDNGPATITFTANAVDGNGATSGTISQTVTVAAPASVTASIAANPTGATAPGTATITWSSANATSVSVTGNGINSSTTTGSQTVTGLATGSYVYTITAQGPNGPATQTATFTVNALPNNAPTITWNTAPGTVASAQSYTVSAHGHDADGNLTQVNVWKNGVPFAFAAGGDGSDGDSGNPTSDTGPASITFTAQAVDGTGATSSAISQTVTIAAPAPVTAAIVATPMSATAPGAATITWSSANTTSVSVSGSGLSSATASGSQTVSGLSAGTYAYTITAQGPNGPAAQTATFTVNAPPNSAPTIAWNTTPGVVSSGQIYIISAHGHDADGNLVQVNVWKNGAGFAFAGGGDGTDGDSGNPTSDTGPASITFTANAVDSTGASSATISQTVTIAAPAIVSASITATPTSATTPGTATITWTSANATSVSVSGNSLGSAAASGSQIVSGLAAGTYDYTIVAQGPNGPAVKTATVTVNPPPNNAPTVAWNTTPGTVASSQSYTISAHGHDADGNLTNVNVWRDGVPYAFAGGGNGSDSDLGNPSTDTGPLTVTYTAESIDANGVHSGTISQVVTITAPPSVSGSISASPATTTAPGSTTISWNTANATAVSVSGSGLNSSAASGSQAVSGLTAGIYTYTLTAQGTGGPISQSATLTVLPANRTVALSVSPAGAGSASGAGIYVEGLSATISASSDAMHVFTGWSGDLGGTVNPLTFTVGAQNYSVIANFAPRTFVVTASVSPAGTGSVNGAGTYLIGATATLSAAPDATHVFSGWSGDISGSANPVSFVVNNATNVTANFAIANFVLTTFASSGGSVTPGGTYAAGTTITISATPAATHRFTDWTGDASGSVPTIAVALDRAKFVQANFAGKSPQTILFDPLGDHALTAPPFTLTAAASSGLPVSFAVVSGSATLTGNAVQVTGAGPVTLQATQAGDAFYLPAAPANRTFNVIASAILKYRGQSRTLLRDAKTGATPPYVIEKP